MGWRSYLYPQVVARYRSRHNRDIRVVEEQGKFKVLVNGSPQSGPYIEGLWRKVFRAFPISEIRSPKSILVLGIAGGTAITLLKTMVPNARITAVDIDKTMIMVGKRWFHLGDISGVTLVCDDAKKFVAHQGKSGAKYNLILVDIFQGRDIPEFIEKEEFWRDIKDLLVKDGVVILNYLREKGYREKSNMLLDKLRRIFHSVNTKEIFLNRFMVAREE